MGMGFAPTWLRQVSPPALQNNFNHCSTWVSERIRPRTDTAAVTHVLDFI